MLTTTNFGLNKPELADSPPDITVTNSNWDAVDKHLKNAVVIPKAGGTTGTAITLNDVTLTDGFMMKFRAVYSNSAAATTVNTKPLYKPGTTTAPTLIAGKAYEIWYDSTGSCFFLKASAEGNAVVANVLVGKTFSNDNDTGLTGTMANRAANWQQALESTQSDGRIFLLPPAGYYDGLTPTYVFLDDVDFIAPNIKAGVNLFGKDGTAKRQASGTVVTNGSQEVFTRVNSVGTFSYWCITVSGLSFTPSVIIAKFAYMYSDWTTNYTANMGATGYGKTCALTRNSVNPDAGSAPTLVRADVSPAYVNSTGFKLPVLQEGNYSWIAFE